MELAVHSYLSGLMTPIGITILVGLMSRIGLTSPVGLDHLGGLPMDVHFPLSPLPVPRTSQSQA